MNVEPRKIRPGTVLSHVSLQPGAVRESEPTIGSMTVGRIFRCACVALLTMLFAAPAASATDVLVLDEDGRARATQDPFVPAATDTPAHLGRRAPRAGLAERRAAAAVSKPTVAGELKRLLADGAIDQATYDERRAAYDRARELVRNKLEGTRKTELGAVVRTLDDIAAAGGLTVSRMPALFLTLDRNIHWWTTGPLLTGGRRLGFSGSELVWQYYPGQGLQLQVLATFGKLNGLWQGKKFDRRLGALLDELLALPTERAGGIAWEYYFEFNDGKPPWVSGMAQGTAVQALARAAVRLDRQEEVLPVAQRALGIFEAPPPEGVRVAEPDGAHYLLYSFAPDYRVLNGFAQAVIGLHDFSAITGDPRARLLYEAGDRVAQRETPSFDTGAWSLYSRGSSKRESDLGYHKLVRDFLSGLCQRTNAEAYCTARNHFTGYLTQRPVVEVLGGRIRGGKAGKVRFRLSKISQVGMEIRLGDRLVLSRSATLTGRGRQFVTWTAPRQAGRYDVRVTAVDLAGNTGSAAGAVEVLKPKPKKRKKRRT